MRYLLIIAIVLSMALSACQEYPGAEAHLSIAIQEQEGAPLHFIDAISHNMYAGQLIVLNAEESTYAQISWSQDGVRLDHCNDQERCELIMNTPGVFNLELKVEMDEAATQDFLGGSEGDVQLSDTAQISLTVLAIPQASSTSPQSTLVTQAMAHVSSSKSNKAEEKATPGWTLEASTSGFGARYGHSAVVYNDAMWVMGGGGKDDAWFSTDGVNWQESLNTTFGVRNFHASAVLNGKIWVMGGYPNFADVHSWDGTTWKQEASSTNVGIRFRFEMVAFQGKLWVIGGASYSGLHNDVWSSSDGITWKHVADAPFPERHGHQVVAFDNRLWVIGGGSGATMFLDTWSSPDGINWTQHSDVPTDTVYHGKATVYNNTLWQMGGVIAVGGSPYDNILWSFDGTNWSKDLHPTTSFSHRYAHRMLTFKNKIWLLSGKVAGSPKLVEEIWTYSE